MATHYKSAPTGALFDPSKGVGSTFGGDAALPRSIASDGRRWLLFFHVLVHVLALAANIVSAVYFYGDFAQTQVVCYPLRARPASTTTPAPAAPAKTRSATPQMKVGAIVAVAMHALGILALLALAAAELKQLAYVFGVAIIFSFLLSALAATVAMSVFTFRSDDRLMESCATRLARSPWSVCMLLFDAISKKMSWRARSQALAILRGRLPADARPGLRGCKLFEHGVQGRRRDRRRRGTRRRAVRRR